MAMGSADETCRYYLTNGPRTISRMERTAVNPLSSLADLTLSQAAAALSAGDCSAVELTDDYLTRIDERDPSLNAYVEVTRQRAKDDAARAADEIAKGRYRGPLHGIPIALKDLVDTAGIRTGSGTAVYRDRVPASDATVARRLADAGAVLLGKTTTHELAWGVTTDNPHTGTDP